MPSRDPRRSRRHPHARQGLTMSHETEPTFTRPVSGTDVGLAFLAVVLAPALAGILVVVASTVLDDQDWLVGVVVPLATLVACAGVWVALIRRGWSWRDLGFVRAHRSLWHLLWEVPLLWLAAVLLTALFGTLAGLDPVGTTSSPGSADTDALALGVGAVALIAVCVTLVVPALEEILFRRLVFGWLEQRFGVVAAVGGSALVFGLVHVAPPVILLQLLIGLGAATLVRVHRTLWAPLALHGLNNAVATGVALTLLLS